MSLIHQIKQHILSNKLIKRAQTVIVGVSGGADSIFLLWALKSIQIELGFQIHAAHFNHRLRKNANQDEEFVVDLAKKWNIDISVGKMSKQKQKGSIEAIAREQRLSFLIKEAKKLKTKSIILAHHKDDLVETFFMRLFRGAGLLGLQSIQTVQSYQDHQLIRPLLNISKKDILKFLQKNKIDCVEDETNSDDAFFRNDIRNNLLPFIYKKFGNSLGQRIAATSKNIAIDYDFMLQFAKKRLNKIVDFKSKQAKLKKSLFLKEHLSIKQMLVRLIFLELCGHLKQIDFDHVSQVIDLIEDGKKEEQIKLPNGIKVSIKSNYVSFLLK